MFFYIRVYCSSTSNKEVRSSQSKLPQQWWTVDNLKLWHLDLLPLELNKVSLCVRFLLAMHIIWKLTEDQGCSLHFSASISHAVLKLIDTNDKKFWKVFLCWALLRTISTATALHDPSKSLISSKPPRRHNSRLKSHYKWKTSMVVSLTVISFGVTFGPFLKEI